MVKYYVLWFLIKQIYTPLFCLKCAEKNTFDPFTFFFLLVSGVGLGILLILPQFSGSLSLAGTSFCRFTTNKCFPEINNVNTLTQWGFPTLMIRNGFFSSFKVWRLIIVFSTIYFAYWIQQISLRSLLKWVTPSSLLRLQIMLQIILNATI